MERATFSDATVPILGDGVKWLGYVPSLHLLWNAGYYLDSYNARQAFSTYDHQVVLRIVWLPLLSESDRTLLHLGVNGRFGHVDDDELQIRSRPEAFPAPYFVDTGKFSATTTRMAGWGKTMPKGGGLGLAATYTFVTYVAAVAQVIAGGQISPAGDR